MITPGSFWMWSCVLGFRHLKIDMCPSPSQRINGCYYTHSDKLMTRQRGLNTNKYSTLACARMSCPACRLNGANNFAIHRILFANVCLSECARENKFYITAALVMTNDGLQAQLFGCLSLLCAKLGKSSMFRCHACMELKRWYSGCLPDLRSLVERYQVPYRVWNDVQNVHAH